MRISRRRPGDKSARNISLQKRFYLSRVRWPASNSGARSLPHRSRSFYLGSIARATYIFIRLSGWMGPVKPSFSCASRLSLYLHALFSFDAHARAAAPQESRNARCCMCERASVHVPTKFFYFDLHLSKGPYNEPLALSSEIRTRKRERTDPIFAGWTRWFMTRKSNL